ncbi:MAG: DUF1566 domain-containing protein [Bacteroidaceae bacterium]|nr:DUF1566 domain-containing protein [Bacteroidaceae bacterium]
MKRLNRICLLAILSLIYCAGVKAQVRTLEVVKNGEVIFSSPADEIDSIIIEEIPTHSGHEYVDLGLPSGLRWATCNVGASKPEEYGDYFAWGETSAKSIYSGDDYAYYGSIPELKESGVIDDDGNLTAAYDAASKNWKGSWRMPTKDEIQELIDNCTTEWTTQNGVYGRKVTSKNNGKSIFMPATGYRFDDALFSDNEAGYYWTSSTHELYADIAYLFGFSPERFVSSDFLRSNGHTVRPVYK